MCPSPFRSYCVHLCLFPLKQHASSETIRVALNALVLSVVLFHNGFQLSKLAFRELRLWSTFQQSGSMSFSRLVMFQLTLFHEFSLETKHELSDNAFWVKLILSKLEQSSSSLLADWCLLLDVVFLVSTLQNEITFWKDLHLYKFF